MKALINWLDWFLTLSIISVSTIGGTVLAIIAVLNFHHLPHFEVIGMLVTGIAAMFAGFLLGDQI